MPLGSLGSLLGRVWKAPAPTLFRQTAPDANDIIVWYMNEPASATSIANHGTAGAVGNLAVQYGEPTLQSEGIFPGGAARIYQNVINGWHTANNTVAAPAALQPAYPITVSLWVCMQSIYANPMSLFAKQYNLGSTWNSPWLTLGFHLQSNTLQPNFYLSIASTLNTILSPIPIGIGVWSHLGMTYDGSFQRCYVNGDEVAAVARAGAIDYGPGGPWLIGSGYAVSGDRSAYLMQDLRVANVARPESYFRDVYEQAYGYVIP